MKLKEAIKTKTIHIFFTEEYPNGYTTTKGKIEAFIVAHELSTRINKTVSVYSGHKNWQGKTSFYIIEIKEPFRTQEQGGFTVFP